jgi:hypothetical protein
LDERETWSQASSIEVITMKRIITYLFIAAVPASAQGDSSQCCEGTGRVPNWPGVRQARYEESLCPEAMMALVNRQQAELNQANPAVQFRPYYYRTTSVPTTPMPAAARPSPLRPN